MKTRKRRFRTGLSAAQTERLALLLEELGETQHIIGKIIRHGYDSHHPHEGSPNIPYGSNKEMLEREIGDAAAALQLMVEAGDISSQNVSEAKDCKLAMVMTYMHFQKGSKHDD